MPWSRGQKVAESGERVIRVERPGLHYSGPEAAERLGVSSATLRRWISESRLSAIGGGPHPYWIHHEELEAFRLRLAEEKEQQDEG